jgi:hypothetical protein
MLDYESTSAEIKAFLEEYGELLELTLKGNSGGFDSSGNSISPTADTTIEGVCTPIVRFRNSEVDGKTIISGDGYCLFQGTQDAAVGMLIPMYGNTYRVVDENGVKSINGIRLYQKLQVRS